MKGSKELYLRISRTLKENILANGCKLVKKLLQTTVHVCE